MPSRSPRRYAPPPVLKAPERTRIAVPASGNLRLGIVADTHSHPHEQGLEHLRATKPDAILHAGDIGDLEVLETLRKMAPLHAVRGNIDGHGAEIPDHRVLEIVRDEEMVLRLLLLHIAVAGPRLRADAFRLAKACEASLVVCGHSHVPFIGLDRGLTLFNPGSLGPRRFTLPILFGELTLDAKKGWGLRHIDAASGQTWHP